MQSLGIQSRVESRYILGGRHSLQPEQSLPGHGTAGRISTERVSSLSAPPFLGCASSLSRLSVSDIWLLGLSKEDKEDFLPGESLMLAPVSVG